MVWLCLVVIAILMWAATSLLYKVGVYDDKEEHIGLKYSVCIGIVFLVISVSYLIIRDEPLTLVYLLTNVSTHTVLDTQLGDAKTLTLDFAECDYVSSAGLRVLLATFKKMKAAKGNMLLANVGENFMDVLVNTGLEAVFDRK